jgi:predicted transglutaminase-like cysteine proteinase
MLGGCGAVETRMKHGPIHTAYEDLIRSAAGLPDAEAIDRVNRFFNSRIRYAADPETWGQTEYWATPAEVLEKGQGDCEDFAIAKFFTLIKIGVKEDLLSLMYGRIEPGGQAHMVAGYGACDIPLILDNIADDVVPADRSRDLRLIMGFNLGSLWMFKNNIRRKAISDNPRCIRQWGELLQRMEAP